MKYLIAIVAVIALLLTIGFIAGNSKRQSQPNVSESNVSMVGETQIIEIKAKGGYQPRNSVAKAGVKTTLRLTTKGTFDCSSSVRIPSMNIEQLLPASGSIDIDLGVQQAGVLHGTCGMGMYPFSINFN
ncbi:MAG: hypothetical protein QG607_259 [Patescibacteria group bacterium]|jgi:plastocyanin domain-containing protein|nr:hypothetical protein [Patescibacteria group bacterium]